MRPIRKAIQFEKLGVQIDVPKQILQQDAKFVHRVIKIPIDTFSLYAYDQKFDAQNDTTEDSFQTDKHVVGDLIYIDILNSPPAPFSIRAKKMVIRDRSVDTNFYEYKN